MLKTILVVCLCTQAAVAHEAYYVDYRLGSYLYHADPDRLEQCRWLLNRSERARCLYFRDRDGDQLVLTYHQTQSGNCVGSVRLYRKGHLARSENAPMQIWEDREHLSLRFSGKSLQGEIWLDLNWRDHGR